MRLNTVRATVRKAKPGRDNEGVDIALDDPAIHTLLAPDAFSIITANVLFSLSDGFPILFDLWEKTDTAEELAEKLGAAFEKGKRRSSTDWFSRFADLEISKRDVALQVLQELSMSVPVIARIRRQEDANPPRRLVDSFIESRGDGGYPQVIKRYRHVVCIETYDDAFQVFPGTETLMRTISTVKGVLREMSLTVED